MNLNELAASLSGNTARLSPCGIRNKSLEESIDAWQWSEPLHRQGASAENIKCLGAGLFLWNESLDRSHSLSQEVHHATGSYWHGVMHRMEPDYANSAYWFRRVGKHPVFAGLQASARGYLQTCDLDALSARLGSDLRRLREQGEWDPFLFIELVELQETQVRDSQADGILRQLQRYEMAHLLNYTYRLCGGNRDLIGAEPSRTGGHTQS